MIDAKMSSSITESVMAVPNQRRPQRRIIGDRRAQRAIPLCAVGTSVLSAVALHWWGAAEVRSDSGAIVFLIALGTSWLVVVATLLFPWLGLDLRDDAIERQNLGALLALCGAVVGVGLTLAGGNIGEG